MVGSLLLLHNVEARGSLWRASSPQPRPPGELRGSAQGLQRSGSGGAGVRSWLLGSMLCSAGPLGLVTALDHATYLGVPPAALGERPR